MILLDIKMPGIDAMEMLRRVREVDADVPFIAKQGIHRVSAYRLRNEFYGRPADNELFADRIAKECLHELGHTFGLIHCADYACVMHSSNSVEGVDLKQEQLCPVCRARVGKSKR